MENPKIMVQDALSIALKQGCEAARVLYDTETQSSYCVRDNKLESLTQSTSRSLFFELFVAGRYGTCSTNKMDLAAIGTLLADAVESFRCLEPDADRQLPDPAICFKGPARDLAQYDSALEQMDPEAKKELAFIPSREVYGTSRLLSVTAEYGDSLSYSYLADTQGFEGESRQSLCSLSAECYVQGRGEARPCDWWIDASITRSGLKTAECGRKALQGALDKIDAVKMDSGKYKMLVDAKVSGSLLAPLMDAIGGRALQQKMSFMEGKLGLACASPLLCLYDDAHLKRGIGARWYDTEGVATRPGYVFDRGVLKRYYIATYEARKMKCAPTSDRPSLLVVHGGMGTKEDLLRQMGDGIYVTGFNGGNCNGATGDFSYGVEGFRVKDGFLAGAVHEMLITGNMQDLWQRLVGVADDALLYRTRRIPSLLFDMVSFSGI